MESDDEIDRRREKLFECNGSSTKCEVKVAISGRDEVRNSRRERVEGSRSRSNDPGGRLYAHDFSGFQTMLRKTDDFFLKNLGLICRRREIEKDT